MRNGGKNRNHKAIKVDKLADDALIDIGPALECSAIHVLHGRPYPVQFRNQGALGAWTAALGQTDEWTRWSRPQTACRDIRVEMLWQLENMYPLAGLPAATAEPVQANRENLAVEISVNLKYQLSKGTIIEATPALETLLAHSDVDLNVPMSMVGLPYAAQYVRFGPEASKHLRVPTSFDPDRVFDGVFCFMSPPATGVDSAGWTLELVFICKRHDRYSGHLILFGVTDRDETTVAAWLDQILAPMANQSVEHYLRPTHAAVSYVVRLFLYMGLKQARVIEHQDHDIALRRLAGLGERKRAKQSQRTASLYNRIVVGPECLPTSAGSHGSGASVAPHWRRGHFRMQPCGLRNLERKLIFVAPVLIHADRLAGDVPAPRPYCARADHGVAA